LHFFDAEDHRQLLLARRSNQFKRGKLSLERFIAEELDAADGDRRSGSRVLLDILDVQQILSEFFLSDEVGRLVVVLGELADGSHIAFLSSLRHPSELKTLDHSLS
jgi:hypothetical protein